MGNKPMTKPVWDKAIRMPLLPRILSGLVVAGILGALVLTVRDLARVELQNADMPAPTAAQLAVETPRAKAEWTRVRSALERRLDQTRPLDLGAVWSTRTGQVCGLVNGRGSFGGLSGMLRFYTVAGEPVFHQDVEHLAFQYGWFACTRDRFVAHHAGAEEPGFCGTELGKRRCYTVINGVRQDDKPPG